MDPKTLRDHNQVDTYSGPKDVAGSLVDENMSATAGRVTAMTPSGEKQSFRLPFRSKIKIYVLDVPEADDDAIIAAVTERFETVDDNGFVLLPVDKVTITRVAKDPLSPSETDDELPDEMAYATITVYVDESRIAETEPLL